jgi:hypothetical protein
MSVEQIFAIAGCVLIIALAVLGMWRGVKVKPSGKRHNASEGVPWHNPGDGPY